MPSQTRQREQLPIDRRGAVPWLWLPYLASPILFGFVIKVFPLDHTKAGLAVVATLGALLFFGTVPRAINRSFLAFTGALILTGVILYLPFWALKAKNNSATADVKPVYSYRDAKANPDAFAKWWNLFVDEVVRTNAIVFEIDPDGTPFQGTLPFRPRPGANVDFYKGRITINNQGYRGEDFPRDKNDVYRILVVGDSVTFGQTLFPDSRSWPVVLQDLAAQNLRCAKPIQIVNGAVNGFRIRNAIDRVHRDYTWLKPDLVLSYFGWNTMQDLGINPSVAAPPAPPATKSRKEIARWYVQKAVVSLINEVESRFAGVLGEMLGTSKNEVDSETAELLRKVRTSVLHADYLELIEQSHRFGYSLALLNFNTAVGPNAPEDAKAFYQSVSHAVRPLLKQVQIHNIMLRELATATGTTFIDTGADLYGKYDDDLYIDIVHFTTKGDIALARNVFSGIRPLLLANPNLGCRPR